MNRKWWILPAILCFLSVFLFPASSHGTSWAYSFVVWDGYIYKVSGEYVTDINSEIGKVTSYSDMEQYTGNFSNVYEEGTKYFSIQGVDTEDAIAIQEEDGRFMKALRDGEYTYEEGRSSGMLAVAGVALLSIAFAVYLVIRRVNR